MHSCYACALFDLEATYSFVSTPFARKNSLYGFDLSHDLYVVTPVVVVKTVNRLSPACSIFIQGHELVADL